MEDLMQITNCYLDEDLALSKDGCNAGKSGEKEKKRITIRKVDGFNFSVDEHTVGRNEGQVRVRLVWRNLFM